MSILDTILKPNNKNLNLRSKQLIESISQGQYREKTEVIQYVNNIISKEVPFEDFCSEEVFCNIVYKVAGQDRSFEFSLPGIKSLYNLLVYNAEDAEQIKLFYNFLDLFLKIDILPDNKFKNSFNLVINMFDNKKIVLSFFQFIIDNDYSMENMNLIIEYLTSARQYYVDENALYSAVIELAESIEPFSKSAGRREKINLALDKDRKSAGIYDIKPEEIASLFYTVEGIKKNVSIIDSRSQDIKKTLESLVIEIEKRIEDLVKGKTEDFSSAYESAKKTIIELIETGKTLGSSEEKVITEIGEKYLKLINELLGVHPEVKGRIEDKKSTESAVTKALFDEKVPFKKRFEAAIARKSPTELYHYAFDSLLKQVIINKPLMIIGPSGPGKSFSVEQIAKLLNLPLYNLGFVTDEFASIKGYMGANGQFVKTSFYEVYKYGGVCFFDEVDNSESKALIELNKIIGGDGYKPYIFPNGEIVTPHPNFRMIAAGNTWGDGADSLHNTREKLDGATINRFAIIPYDYDINLEKAILKDYPDMFQFAIAFRTVLVSINYDDIISTRDMADIKMYLSTGCYTIEEILDLKFIKNKRVDTLTAISSQLSRVIPDNSILKTFVKMMDSRSRTRRR